MYECDAVRGNASRRRGKQCVINAKPPLKPLVHVSCCDQSDLIIVKITAVEELVPLDEEVLSLNLQLTSCLSMNRLFPRCKLFPLHLEQIMISHVFVERVNFWVATREKRPCCEQWTGFSRAHIRVLRWLAVQRTVRVISLSFCFTLRQEVEEDVVNQHWCTLLLLFCGHLYCLRRGRRSSRPRESTT